jgi:NADH:ubiquinone oxidoreductase subunit 5 (subunit L)/multisubunit Na+/H+ antiporter MnhA subunit
MGGLWKKTPITFATFMIGTLALAGVYPLSGFYSKDQILLLALEHNKALFVMGAFTAFLTAYYMGRECFVVFFGKPRDHHAYDHAHESPAVMTLPRCCRLPAAGAITFRTSSNPKNTRRTTKRGKVSRCYSYRRPDSCCRRRSI